MPLYDYSCSEEECDHKIEIVYPVANRDILTDTLCPACGEGKMVRALGNDGGYRIPASWNTRKGANSLLGDI